MKKLFLIIVTALPFVNCSIAQPNITKGTTQKLVSKYQIFLGKIGSKFYYLETDNIKTFISVFNYALELEKTVEVQKPIVNTEFYRQKEFIIGDKIYLWGLINNMTTKNGEFLVTVLNEDLLTINEWKHVFSAPMGNTCEIYYLNKMQKFEFLDKGYLDADKNINLVSTIVNEKYEVEKVTKQQLNYKWNEIKVKYEYVTENGNYLLIGKAINDYRTIIFNTQDNVLFDHKIDTAQINYLTLNVLENTIDNKFYFSGFYSSEGNSFKGTFLYTIDIKTGNVSGIAKSAFTEEFTNNYLTKENEKIGVSIPFHELKRNFFNKAGNIVLVTQQRKVVKESTIVRNGNYSHTEISYNTKDLDILTVCIKPNGEMLWSQIIPRLDESNYSYTPTELNDKIGFSFTMYEDDNSINFIMFDSEKNHQLIKKSPRYVTDVYSTFKGKINLMKFQILNENGRKNVSVIGNLKSFGYLYPLKSFAINNELILYNYIGFSLTSLKPKYFLEKFKF